MYIYIYIYVYVQYIMIVYLVFLGKTSSLGPPLRYQLLGSDGFAAAQHKALIGGAAAASDVQRHALGVLGALRADFDGDLTRFEKEPQNAKNCTGLLDFLGKTVAAAQDHVVSVRAAITLLTAR